MPTYTVTAITWANTTHTVTAATPEEATEHALGDAPNLCHQCTGGRHGTPGLEVGDDLEVTGIHDEDGNEYPVEDTELDRLRAEVKELRARLADMEGPSTTYRVRAQGCDGTNDALVDLSPAGAAAARQVCDSLTAASRSACEPTLSMVDASTLRPDELPDTDES
ncbi:hypothetical protein Q8791_23030 [Nocardiopsis sp. CT-R113]|uniref:Uncharacterized protein n=1 Tax=Nocardiopsis codii TaxID=3065942 RepID=A0ABU7KCZ3_9ACTN|nr:hypothetical protein [Nocardiopsis sp. CT-R113]MEE2040095.1 hypothetical protein [Nocardiopsis sp. CT-R113]